MLHWKAMTVLSIVDWWKRHNINKWIFSRTKIFSKKSESSIRFIQLCNKNRFKKNARNQLKFAKKVDLASLKSEVDKLDID